MPTNQRERLASIHTFAQLIAYLQDELDWPVGRGDFEDETFEYTPEEIGIDAKNAAKIQEIKRLRPLVAGQPWGIFFVKFEPKRLPVVALRRILRRVALKRRTSANDPDYQAWATDDLLFVSNYGEGEERQIAFAHFSEPRGGRDLPTLKVLGWDSLDTPLRLDAVAGDLQKYLTWPDDEQNHEAWRESWRAAFTLHHREVITTSRQLSEHLAELARKIRGRTGEALSIESATGPLTRLMKAFQKALVHELDEDGFADMYAQTITYGLLSARITDPTRPSADDLTAHMRTNPFLKELMDSFLHAGGRRSNGGGQGIDFDELGIAEVVELLDRASIEAVVRDFGDKNPLEDPVIHFYEHFLEQYDKKQKVKRGVFYTPQPVVSYIVRSVDKLLRTEFGLADGLADTTSWGEMANRCGGLKIPKGTSPAQAFVQILDPAAGTGTFLVEAIDLIHKTMTEKWVALGHDQEEIAVLWNEYVPNDLLPRLHGYELLMAPYAIAHLKIGLKLYETGYRFESDERAQVYLTNALEPPKDVQTRLSFLPALALEVELVNQIKRNHRFTVVIGNPPYLGEAGRGGDWIAALMRGRESQSGRKTLNYFKVDGKPLKEKNPKWVNNLYVRFTRLSHWLLEQTGVGIHGFITDHSYVDSPTFRGVRWALSKTFDQLYIVDLHGSSRRREVAPAGDKDVNVFDIEEGTAIGLFVKTSRRIHEASSASLHHADCWGERKVKYDWLLAHHVANSGVVEIKPGPPYYLLKPFDTVRTEGYDKWTPINEIFPVNSVGIVTARDALTVQWSEKEVWRVAVDVASGEPEEVRQEYALPDDVQDWKIAWAQEDLRRAGPSKSDIERILYRPFDTRFTYYTGQSRGFLCRPRIKVMGHMLNQGNYAIITARSNKFPEPNHFFCSRTIVEAKCGEASTQSATFPLYVYPGVSKAGETLFSQWPKGKDDRAPNLDPAVVQHIAEASDLNFVSDGSGDLRKTFGPEDLLAWIYAVFHSSSFRERYEELLKIDFPRVPHPGNRELFQLLVEAGNEVMALHLLESPQLDKPVTTYIGPTNPEVGRVGWSDGTVWFDAAETKARAGQRAIRSGTMGIEGVPEEVWDFHIGGYRVCHKWLNARKGRTLSGEDIDHYQKIVVALHETIRIMGEIDEVIDDHGGWPDAFGSE